MSHRNERGFTLIELIVALALAAIISLMISAVGTQAQTVYEQTTTRVELYQKFRYALGDMKEHIENWRLTADLEYFIDAQGNRNGHWDEGEEIKKPENLDGGTRGKYDEGASITQRTFEWERTPGVVEELRHDNYSIYFKAPTTIGGALRVANIEYYLSDPTQDPNPDGSAPRVGATVSGEDFKNLTLVKTVRYIEDQGDDEFFKNERKVAVRSIELCQNVTDIKFEYYYDNQYDSRPGAYLTPEKERLQEIAKSEYKPKVLPDGGLRKEFLYGGFQNIMRGNALAGRRDTKKPTNNREVRFSVGSAQSGINFSELRYGDSIYIWSDSGGSRFKTGEYTVFRNVNGELEFQEPVDSSTWDGKDQSSLRYRAGYIPSAVRVTLRVLDAKGSKPRILQMVVHPFRKKS